MASVPADCVWGCDNVNVTALPPGFSVYAGYENGPFANMAPLRARFPQAYLIPVATRLPGSKGARAVDAETGTLAPGQAGNLADTVAFLNGYEGSDLPIVYTMASWASAMEHYLAMNGHARSSYYLWSAHYAGQHLCGPQSLGGCGYGASMADGTQYATGVNDYSVFRGYVVPGQPSRGTVPGTVGMLGASAPVIATIQAELNAWARLCSFPPLIIDQDFGAKTYLAVRAFQAFRHLTVDGIVGPETFAALAVKPSPVTKVLPVRKPRRPALPGTVLRLGSQGKQVAALQYYLRNSGIRGVRGIEADGGFGGQTLRALREFQAWARFKPAGIDGVYGPQTQKALAKVAVG